MAIDINVDIDKQVVAFSTETKEFFLFTRMGERLSAKSWELLEKKYYLIEKVDTIHLMLLGLREGLFDEEDNSGLDILNMRGLSGLQFKLDAIEKLALEVS